MRLVKATENDLPLMMAWRSNPLVYQGFYQQNSPLEWMEHVNWFTSRNSDWRTFLIYYGGDLSILARPVGVVTIGQLDYWECEIGIYIGELTLWGKGVGRGALESAIDWVRVNKGSHVVAVRSTILDNNKRSNRLFKSVGFYRVGKAREGESLYRLVL